MRNKYNEHNVIKALSNKAAINVNSVNKSIEVIKNSCDIGIKSWGKIDFLTNIHKYVICFVNNINNKKVIKNYNSDNVDNDTNYKNIRNNKRINMVAMTKASMKNVRNK